MPRDEEYSRKKLERFLPIFRKAAVGGVREVLDGYQATGHVHRKNTRRSIVRDHIVDNLRGDLMLDPDVSIRDRNQTTYFEIVGEYRLLAKMANTGGMVALNPNQTSFAYQANRQSDMFASEELPETTNLYLSYVSNPMEPREPFVYVICPKKDGYHWRFEIEPPAVKLAGEIGGGLLPTGDDDAADLVRIPQEKKPDDISE
jgi:hypothetical protein